MYSLFIKLLVIGIIISIPSFALAADGNKNAGEIIFKKNCAGCHGQTGEGNGPAASSLFPKPANFVSPAYKDSLGKNPRDYKDSELIEIIKDGRKGTAMPSWRKILNSDDIADVMAYERSLRK